MENPLGTSRRLAIRSGYGLSLAVCVLTGLTSLSGLAMARPSADGAQQKVRKAPPAAPVEQEPVFEMTPVPPPPPPLTPGQMPPKAPSVTYEDGLLSISAENSTLADILIAVKASTGAAMDVPGSAGAERVWITLGPGPARAILAALLTGTSLDYVIQASDTDQTQIQSVLLTPRIKGGKSTDSGPAGQGFSSRYRQFRNKPNFGAPDSTDSDSTTSQDSSTGIADSDAGAVPAASTPAPSTSADAQPSSVDPPTASTPSPSLSARLPMSVTEADAHPAPVANPEQAIPQMQNLFELRKQLQEQQNAQQKAATK